ncbi:MAG: DoxX family protein [Chloroflexota bacterium]|nr:DoxX family protein [Chloroflexota bacterium]
MTQISTTGGNLSYAKIDRAITRWMARNGITLLRISIGVVFFWFGIIKFVPGLSPADELATRTISTLTFGLIPPDVSRPLLALWEVVIGLGFIIGRPMRLILPLLFLQMAGTVTPLFLFPTETFSVFPIAPTLEGQYIIKNIIIVSAAIAVGATVRGGDLVAEPEAVELARDIEEQDNPGTTTPNS